MPVKLKIPLLLKRLLTVAVVVTVLCLVLIIIARNVLASHGISYERLSFRFPSTATVHGLSIKTSAVEIQAGRIRAQWSWRALLRGDFRSNVVEVDDATVWLLSADHTKDTTASTTVIDIQRVAFRNVRLISNTVKDTTLITLRDVRAAGLYFDGKLRVDTLINTNSDYRGSYAPSGTNINDSTAQVSAGFSIQSVPEFTVGYFRFTDCDFNIRYDTTQYQVGRFNLLFSGLNNHDVINMKLHRLAFRYQDSVDVDMALDDATLDGGKTARIKQLLLEIPGLRIDVPEATFSGGGGLAMETRLDSSYVDTNLLRFIIPSLNAWLPPDSRIRIEGHVGLRPGQLTLERTSVSLGKDGNLSGSGKLQWGSGGDSVDLVIHRLESSLYGLAKWGGLSIPAGQPDFRVKGQLHAAGINTDLRSYGKLDLGELGLDFRVHITGVDGGRHLAFELAAPFVEPRKVVTQFDNDLKLANLTLKGSTALGQTRVLSLQARLTADSVYQNQRWYAAPVVDVDYAPTHSVANVALGAGAYAASVEIAGDILSGDKLNCNGSLHIRTKQNERDKPLVADLAARFRGIVLPRDRAADIHFDTVTLSTSDRLYTSSGRLQASQSPDRSFQVALVLNKYLDFQAYIGADVADWVNSNEKLTRFPSLTVAMNAHADTTLMKALTGTSAHIELEDLNLVSMRDEVSLSFRSDTLYWRDFHTRALKGDVRYHPGYITGKIETPELITPAAVLDSVRFEVSTANNTDFTVSLDTYLPEIDRAIGLRYQIASLQDDFKISFSDSAMQLGINRWRTDRNGALYVSKSFDRFSGDLSISHQSQQAILHGNGPGLTWTLKDIDIFPITKAIASNPEIHGLLNASVTGNFQEGAFRFNGSLTRTSIDSVRFGDFLCDGAMSNDSLSFTGQLADRDYSISGMISKSKQGPAQFGVQAKNIDLRKFSSLLPVAASTLTVNGILNAEVSGNSGETLTMKGYVSLPDLEIISSEYDIYLKSDNDSLVLNGTTAILDNFVFRDRYGKPLTIDGSANLPGQALDISIRTDRFRLLDRTLKKATLTGEMDLACNLNVRGRKGAYKISGTLGTLDGASVTYHYKSTVTLDEREQEIEFVRFDEQVPVVREATGRRRTKKATEWDVNFDVGKVDVTVLFSQVNQDHIKTTASGRVAFTTGNSAEPSAFGLIESNSGDIAYHVPMISNLRMTINKAGIRWVGEVGKPLLSFNGSQTFRITPNEISALWTNKTDRWPISVIAKVSDRPLNDLVLNFDLSSTNNDVSNWITTLPPDTRQAYAVSLLIRGRINTGGSADVNLLTQTMVSKMNEISSRNIKSADVSFYDESRGPNSTDGGTSKIGYSITKGLANKKMRIVVGGSVDLTGQADPSMPDVKLEYVLREDPTITLRAGKANVYTGVIDGNVDESSFGFTYIKRFRNLFRSHQKQPKE